jgi:hypothetical protein
MSKNHGDGLRKGIRQNGMGFGEIGHRFVAWATDLFLMTPSEGYSSADSAYLAEVHRRLVISRSRRNPEGAWVDVASFPALEHATLTHGICKDCAKKEVSE